MAQAYRDLGLEVWKGVERVAQCCALLDTAPPRFQDPALCFVSKSLFSTTPLKVEISALCADKMLLAWYHLHKAEVFAVLTDDSDFYVYGVHRVRKGGERGTCTSMECIG